MYFFILNFKFNSWFWVLECCKRTVLYNTNSLGNNNVAIGKWRNIKCWVNVLWKPILKVLVSQFMSLILPEDLFKFS